MRCRRVLTISQKTAGPRVTRKGLWSRNDPKGLSMCGHKKLTRSSIWQFVSEKLASNLCGILWAEVSSATLTISVWSLNNNTLNRWQVKMGETMTYLLWSMWIQYVSLTSGLTLNVVHFFFPFIPWLLLHGYTRTSTWVSSLELTSETGLMHFTTGLLAGSGSRLRSLPRSLRDSLVRADTGDDIAAGVAGDRADISAQCNACQIVVISSCRGCRWALPSSTAAVLVSTPVCRKTASRRWFFWNDQREHSK